MLKSLRIPGALVAVFIVMGILLVKRSFTPAAEGAKPDYLRLQKTAQEKVGIIGEFTTKDFDPMEFLTTWNFNNLPPDERQKFYKESTLPDGRTLREYWFHTVDKEIEIAPGVFFPAWAYNGQVPAPTIRATEGDLIRIHFQNLASKPHTMHFHGFHTAG